VPALFPAHGLHTGEPPSLLVIQFSLSFKGIGPSVNPSSVDMVVCTVSKPY